MCMKAECQVHAKRARQRDRGLGGREDELLDMYNLDGRYGGQYGIPQGGRGPLDLPPLLKMGPDPRMEMLNGMGGDLLGMGGGLGVGLGGLNGGLPGGPRGLGSLDFGLGGGMGMGQPHGLGAPGLIGRDPRLGGMRGEQFIPGMPIPHRGLGDMRGMPGMEGLGGNIDARYLPDLSGRFNAMDLGDPRGYAHPRFPPLQGQYHQEFRQRDNAYGRERPRDDRRNRGIRFEDEEHHSRRFPQSLDDFGPPDAARRHLEFHQKKAIQQMRELVREREEEREMKKKQDRPPRADAYSRLRRND